MHVNGIEAGPLISGAVAAVYFRFLHPRHLHWGATAEEASGKVAGDELMPGPDIVSTRIVGDRRATIGDLALAGADGPRGAAVPTPYDWIERRVGIDIRQTVYRALGMAM